jgi:hypothetical protein
MKIYSAENSEEPVADFPAMLNRFVAGQVAGGGAALAAWILSNS